MSRMHSFVGYCWLYSQSLITGMMASKNVKKSWYRKLQSTYLTSIIIGFQVESIMIIKVNFTLKYHDDHYVPDNQGPAVFKGGWLLTKPLSIIFSSI